MLGGFIIGPGGAKCTVIRPYGACTHECFSMMTGILFSVPKYWTHLDTPALDGPVSQSHGNADRENRQPHERPAAPAASPASGRVAARQARSRRRCRRRFCGTVLSHERRPFLVLAETAHLHTCWSLPHPAPAVPPSPVTLHAEKIKAHR